MVSEDLERKVSRPWTEFSGVTECSRVEQEQEMVVGGLLENARGPGPSFLAHEHVLHWGTLHLINPDSIHTSPGMSSQTPLQLGCRHSANHMPHSRLCV